MIFFFSAPVIRGRAGRGKAAQTVFEIFRSEIGQTSTAAFPLRPFGPPPP